MKAWQLPTPWEGTEQSAQKPALRLYTRQSEQRSSATCRLTLSQS